MKNYADLCTALREGFFTTRAGTSGNQACEAADVIEDLLARVEIAESENKRLREALTDMYAGWKYIRANHGDLYGVGWDRCDEIARTALGGEP